MKQLGFTTIELVTVIIILAVIGVTATSQFLNISEDTEVAKTKAYAAAFKQSVDFANAKWAIGNHRD